MSRFDDALRAARRRLIAARPRPAPRPVPAGAPDLVFVTPPRSAPGWILEAICREIGARLPALKVEYHHAGEPLPPARWTFHSHYMFYVESLRAWGPPPAGRHHVFATHLEPEKHRIDGALLARLLDRCDGVICMNRALRDVLHGLGVDAGRLHVVPGAADRTLFRPHARQHDGLVGFSAAFYERKSPDRILEIVRAMPHRRFVLLGRHWSRWSRFAELQALPNFEYAEPGYEEYPAQYARMSVFVSASRLEGGPIPLLESMMSNVVPVASRTGFAPDLVEHGRNGLLFDVDARAPEICALIDQAFALQADVSRSVAHCDWIPFTAEVGRAMALPADALPR